MMRRQIGQWKEGQVNNRRMINHASAYVLFVIGIILDEVLNYYFKEVYFIDWILTASIGTVSMIFLANILWHLGTKEKQIEIFSDSFCTNLDEEFDSAT